MIKKKLSILLLLSLAVLFIGSFSTSYARTLTATEIMNFVLNGYQYKLNSIPSQTIIDNVKAQEQGFEVWAEYTETYEGQYALAFNGYGVSFYYYNGSQANLNKYSPYIYDNVVNVNTSYLSRKRADYNVNENKFYDFSNNNLGLGSSNRFFYTDFNIKTNVNNATPSGANLYTAGTSLPDGNVFAENFISSDKFEFSPTLTNFELCSINGLVEPSEVYVYDRNNQDYLTLGYLEKFSNLDNITISRYRYTKANGWVETSVNAFNDFSEYNVQDDILTYTIDVSKISADTLVIFNFTPKNIVDFSNQVFALYIKSPFTFISNGVIYPAQTFSGDYFNNYNDDSNTDKIVDNNKSDSDKIIDTLTDDSQVDGMLAELVSGDAEDIARKFGFTLFNRYYYDFIHDTIEDIVEVLEQEGDVYFDYSMHGEAPTRIYASQFTTPDGPLKTFLSMFLIACTVFAFYKYIADIIELISTGNVLEALREFNVDRNIFKM